MTRSRLTTHLALPLALVATLAACGGNNTSNEPGAYENNTTPANNTTSANNTSTTPRDLVMFISTGKYPTTGGLAGLDAACNADEKKPTGSFKALVASPDRLPDTPGCDHMLTDENDWVFAPERSYVNLDGELLFTTNAIGIFDDYPEGNAKLSRVANFATALDREWCFFEESHCDGWTSDTGKMRVGWSDSYGGAFLDGGELDCGAADIVCVEQP